MLYTASFTPTPIPSSSVDQLAPFHFATRLAVIPPAVVKFPPAYSAGPPPSSYTARAVTQPFNAPESVDQFAPSHFAMPWL